MTGYKQTGTNPDSLTETDRDGELIGKSKTDKDAQNQRQVSVQYTGLKIRKDTERKRNTDTEKRESQILTEEDTDTNRRETQILTESRSRGDRGRER